MQKFWNIFVKTCIMIFYKILTPFVIMILFVSIITTNEINYSINTGCFIFIILLYVKFDKFITSYGEFIEKLYNAYIRKIEKENKK